MDKKYQWSEGRDLQFDAQVVGESVEALVKRDGKVLPRAFVDDATAEDSPTHSMLEWDNVKAGDHWRLQQAGRIIRNLRIVKGEDAEGEPVLERPYIRILEGESSAYYPVAVVMSNAEMRQAAIADAISFLSRAKNKLVEFRELEKQYRAVQQIENDLVDVQMKLRRTERAKETTRALQAV